MKNLNEKRFIKQERKMNLRQPSVLVSSALFQPERLKKKKSYLISSPWQKDEWRTSKKYPTRQVKSTWPDKEINMRQNAAIPGLF